MRVDGRRPPRDGLRGDRLRVFSAATAQVARVDGGASRPRAASASAQSSSGLKHILGLGVPRAPRGASAPFYRQRAFVLARWKAARASGDLCDVPRPS